MMQVTQETREDWRVAAVRGRIDSETADDLEDQLRKVIAENARVAVDFRGVDYISSAGLRAIIQAARAAQGRNAEFVVCQLSAPVKKVFDMSGMGQILKVQGELPC